MATPNNTTRPKKSRAEWIASRRRRAKMLGNCSICTARPARQFRETCQECSDKAKERVMAARKRKG